MKTIGGEVVMHREPEAFLALPDDQALQQVTRAWADELAAQRVDFDYQFGMGQLARLHRLKVEGRLLEWLQKQQFQPAAIDVAGSFLMGFWAVAGSPDPALATALLDAAQSGPAARDPNARGTALRAVAAAASSNKALRQQLAPRLQALRAAAGPELAAVLDAALTGGS